ncbi:MAG: hypothetical protein ORO03_08740 [Alphaproteobacteria bacterium]|nr:hypothetical protein [Alphaproteobacteria bacterium]
MTAMTHRNPETAAQAVRRLRIATGYQPRPFQAELHENLARFNVLVAHRRFGKTVFAVNELIDRALRCPLPRPRLAYIAPLAVQAKTIVWDYLKAYTAAIPRVTSHESELRVDLPNGARISLYGADNPDRLRGLYFDGVVLDEYGDMPPRLWSEIIRPALADRLGGAIFIGTPKGRNQFYDLYQQAQTLPDWHAASLPVSVTRAIAETELEAARQAMSHDQYLQEFECAFTAAVQGSYYGALLQTAEQENRLTAVPWEPNLPVETWWDIGIGDATAIWFVQRSHREVRLIDYYEASGEGLPHYCRVIQSRGLVYGRHLAPHDIAVRELSSGVTRIETARQLGIEFEIAPRLSIEEGIEAVRILLPRCWFDATKCAVGIESLRNYRKDFDDRLKIWREKPRHDWTSHAADAFRMGAIARPPGRWSERLNYRPNGVV